MTEARVHKSAWARWVVYPVHKPMAEAASFMRWLGSTGGVAHYRGCTWMSYTLGLSATIAGCWEEKSRSPITWV